VTLNCTYHEIHLVVAGQRKKFEFAVCVHLKNKSLGIVPDPNTRITATADEESVAADDQHTPDARSVLF
jgi:hypothetical protein